MTDVGVLDKAVAILHLFPDGEVHLHPAAVAASLDMSPPTAYRLMKSLAAHGILESGPEGYRLGITLLHLGSKVADGLALNRSARPQLEWLRDQTSENAELHVVHGCSRVPIEVIASRQNLRPMGQVGVPFPLHVGASAKVLLAWMEEADRRALLHACLEGNGGAQDFDMDLWVRELRRTREEGCAESDSEREKGVASIAAPIRDRSGSVVAAMVVSGPSTRLMKDDLRSAARKATVEAAAEVSRALGYQGDPVRRTA